MARIAKLFQIEDTEYHLSMQFPSSLWWGILALVWLGLIILNMLKQMTVISTIYTHHSASTLLYFSFIMFVFMEVFKINKFRSEPD